MGKQSKGPEKKVEFSKKERFFCLLATMVGGVGATKGLNYLAEMDFMQPKADAAPDSKNYKPLIATAVAMVGSGAGAVFIPNKYVSALMAGVATGSANATWDVTVATLGIGAAPRSSDVERYMNLYKDLEKGSSSIKFK